MRWGVNTKVHALPIVPTCTRLSRETSYGLTCEDAAGTCQGRGPTPGQSRALGVKTRERLPSDTCWLPSPQPKAARPQISTGRRELSGGSSGLLSIPYVLSLPPPGDG